MTILMDIEATAPDAAAILAGALRRQEPRALAVERANGLALELGKPEFADPEEKAPAGLETRGAAMASELESLQRQAEQAMRAYVFATLDHVASLVDSVDASVSLTVKNGHLRGKALAVHERLDDFFASARQVMSASNDGERPPSRRISQPAPAAKTRDGEPPLAARLQLLTARENTVLELLLKGLPNKQISYQLGVSIATAKAHIGAILRKLNVSNRSRVIALLANLDSGDRGGLCPES